MLIETINNLTREQRAELLLRGIESPLLSAWRNGKRRPTYAQAVSIAVVAKIDIKDLLLEIALGDALSQDKKIIETELLTKQ